MSAFDHRVGTWHGNDMPAAVSDAKHGTGFRSASDTGNGAVAARVRRHGEATVAILAVLPVLPLSVPIDEWCAAARVRLEAAGVPVGGNDLLIAAQALSHELVLVTASTRQLRRVDGLRVESWISPGSHRNHVAALA